MEPAVNKEPLVLFPWRVSVSGGWSQVCAGGICCALLTGRGWFVTQGDPHECRLHPPFPPCPAWLYCLVWPLPSCTDPTVPGPVVLSGLLLRALILPCLALLSCLASTFVH